MDKQSKNQYWAKLNYLFFNPIIVYIGKTMALYQASDFTGFSDSYAVPAGSGDVIFTGSVNKFYQLELLSKYPIHYLLLGNVVIHFMEIKELYSLSPHEDVTILSFRSKLWF